MRFSLFGVTVTTGKDAEPEPAPARVWVRGDDVFFEPEDGAIPYDCVACRDATGGACPAHADPGEREFPE